MKRCLLLLLTVMLLLTACVPSSEPVKPTESTGAETSAPPQPDPPATDPPVTEPPITEPPATEPPVTEPPEPVYVYPAAVEDYLLPLEDFSWEREYAPEFVMIHFTSAVMLNRNDPFNMELVRRTFVDYEVSIHYIVQRDGTVYCYIPENRAAWHAGKGEWAGDPKYTNAMNRYAIGIELVGIGSESDMSIYLSAAEYQALDDSFKGFTDQQYDTLKLLVADICSRNNISMDRDHVIGHEDYTDRKTDPGELFDWNRLLG